MPATEHANHDRTLDPVTFEVLKNAFATHDVTEQDPPEPVATRPVWFPDTGWIDTDVFARDDLAAGTHLRGPVIVEQLDSTTVVPPRTVAEIDAWLNIRIHLEEA